jgi:DNA-binding transcriptional regulator YiaG
MQNNSSSNFIEFQLYKYPFLRHVFRKRRTAKYGTYRNESFHEAYLRKKNARLLRRTLLQSDEEAKNFFDWIWSIQEKLHWSNRKFADEIGVSLQTLKLWRNFHGHYPSQRSLQKLLRLDYYATVVTTKKVVYGVTTTNSILK